MLDPASIGFLLGSNCPRTHISRWPAVGKLVGTPHGCRKRLRTPAGVRRSPGDAPRVRGVARTELGAPQATQRAEVVLESLEAEEAVVARWRGSRL